MPDLPELETHQHRLLERQGGATAVARLLCAQLPAIDCRCSSSFELAQPGEAEAWPVADQRLEPTGLAQLRKSGQLIHLHSSLDWPGLLQSLAESGPGISVLSAHDCSLLTGGCAYPLGCEKWRGICADCPRNFPDSAARQAGLKSLIERVNPYLVSPSAWLARMLRETFPGVKVKVIPNAINWPEKLKDRNQARQSLGLAKTAKAVLFLAHGGEAAAYKGGEFFRRIFELIKAEHPEAVCLLVGGSGQSRQGDLIFLPYLEGEALETVLRAADILLYPSLADNHPLSVLQAQSQELPVLAFALGGIPEQIEPGRTGFLAPPIDMDNFARLAGELLGNPHELRQVGRQARQLGAKRFAAPRMARDYLMLYRTLIN